MTITITITLKLYYLILNKKDNKSKPSSKLAYFTFRIIYVYLHIIIKFFRERICDTTAGNGKTTYPQGRTGGQTGGRFGGLARGQQDPAD